MQLIVGTIMLWISSNVQVLLDNVSPLRFKLWANISNCGTARRQHQYPDSYLHFTRFLLCYARYAFVLSHIYSDLTV